MRNNQWGEKVKIRLSYVIDLNASDRIQHHDSLQNYFLMLREGEREQSKTDYVLKIIEDICLFLENNDDCQQALSDLLSVVTRHVGY